MADEQHATREPDENQPLDSHAQPHADETHASEDGSGEESNGEELEVGEDEAGPSTESPVEPSGPRSLVEVNRLTHGVVTLHYPSRDVEVPLDGDSALRLLTAFRRSDDLGLGDRLDPEASAAFTGWLVLDIASDEAPLAISWMPQLTREQRMAIDPPLSVS